MSDAVRSQASLSSEVALYRDRCSSLGFQLEDTTAALETAKTDFLNLQWQAEEELTRLKSEKREKERTSLLSSLPG